MNNKLPDHQRDQLTEDPNSLTEADREVMNKTDIKVDDLKSVRGESGAGRIAPEGSGFSVTAAKTIFGALLVITGIFIAVITAWTVFGIVFGALFVIGGVWLPFSNLGSVRGGSVA